MTHWLVIAGSIVGAVTVLYTAARRALRRLLAAVRTAIALWRLPECVESLTTAVGKLTAEVSQLRSVVTQNKPVEHHRFGEEWPWRNEHR